MRDRPSLFLGKLLIFCWLGEGKKKEEIDDVKLTLRVVNFSLGVGEDDSRRPGGPRSQQQQQAQMNQSLHSELALSKEQLYDLFQQILGVKKFEHQLLFNALQVRYVLFLLGSLNISSTISIQGC